MREHGRTTDESPVLPNAFRLSIVYTWSGFEAAKTAPWPSRGLTIVINSLSPQMSELVEDAIAS